MDDTTYRWAGIIRKLSTFIFWNYRILESEVTFHIRNSNPSLIFKMEKRSFRGLHDLCKGTPLVEPWFSWWRPLHTGLRLVSDFMLQLETGLSCGRPHCLLSCIRGSRHHALLQEPGPHSRKLGICWFFPLFLFFSFPFSSFLFTPASEGKKAVSGI